MKCHRPGTDIELEFTVYCNGVRCDEYFLPTTRASALSDPDTQECFVPVAEGSKLTLIGQLNGTILNGRFDLLADGSFVYNRIIEPNKDGTPKTHRRKRTDVTTVTHAPRDHDITSPFSKKVVKVLVDGDLTVETLPDNIDDRFLSGSGDALGVGSLAVIASFNQSATERYGEEGGHYPDYTVGDWDLRQEEVRGSGIIPTQHLTVDITNDKLPQVKMNNFNRCFEAPRFGSKPWAKLIFYYRTKAAILEAGCYRCPFDESRTLLPVPGYVEVTEEDNAHAGNSNNLFMTPGPELSQKAAKSFRPSMTGSRSLGLGQPLKLSGNVQMPSPAPRDRNSSSISRMATQYDAVAQNELEAINTEPEPDLNQLFGNDDLNALNALNSGENILDNFMNSGFDNDFPFQPLPETGAPETEIKEEETSDSETMLLRLGPPARKQSQAPAQNQSSAARKRLETQLASPSTTPHSQRTSSLSRPAPPSASLSSAKRSVNLMSNTSSPAMPSSGKKSIESPSTHALKHKTPGSPHSRESTPTKRLRLTDFNERKERLQLALQEQGERKAAAQRAYEEQERLRREEEMRRAEDDEERAEMERQLAEMEQLRAAQEEEIRQIEQLTQQQRVETERIRREREMDQME